MDRRLMASQTIEMEDLDGFPYLPGPIVPELPIFSWQRCHDRFKAFGATLPGFFAKEADKLAKVYMDRLVETSIVFLGVLQLILVSRRIVTTTKGHLGMATKASKQGDSIFLLKDCNMPLVLRPHGDGTYHLVGECFVHGIMDGEAMDQFLQDDSVEEMNVVLR
ncbi:HET-domain-containing protein [Apiospora saccharicola]|uniref:HET-domain-containing protein n=1 Tax=Apiospora saccharicola TaxID=335842 RepID=A0ABR1W0K3_9PEZI